MAGIACGEKRYIDFVFGVGDYSMDRRPKHRSLAYVAKHHFRKDDGTFWENTTGYDFATYVYMARMLVAGNLLSEMDPTAFPGAQFDFTHPDSPFYRPLRRALYGYLAYCLPDGNQIVIGDYGEHKLPFRGASHLWYIGRLLLKIPELAALKPENSDKGFLDFIYPCGPWGKGVLPHRSTLMPRGLAVLRHGEGDHQLYASLPHLLEGGGHQHADRLNLIFWAQNRLLFGEKEYAVSVDQRAHVIHKMSSAHNVVLVGGKNQDRGVRSTVHHFLGSDWLQIADASVDDAYPWTLIAAAS